MSYIKDIEDYKEDRLNQILDKIFENGKDSLRANELNYLDAYSKGDIEKLDRIEKIEGIKTFDSEDGNFHFRYDETVYFDGEVHIRGTMYVPDLESDNGHMIKGIIYGTIVCYGNDRFGLDFEKEDYDILDFCIDLEYELDIFIDDLIDSIDF